MRHMWVQLLKPGGVIEWRHMPWGKRSLDILRREGTILFVDVQ
jgi:hypothetical protein